MEDLLDFLASPFLPVLTHLSVGHSPTSGLCHHSEYLPDRLLRSSLPAPASCKPSFSLNRPNVQVCLELKGFWMQDSQC